MWFESLFVGVGCGGDTWDPRGDAFVEENRDGFHVGARYGSSRVFRAHVRKFYSLKYPSADTRAT